MVYEGARSGAAFRSLRARTYVGFGVTPGRTQLEQIESASPAESGHEAEMPVRPIASCGHTAALSRSRASRKIPAFRDGKRRWAAAMAQDPVSDLEVTQ